MFEKFRGREKPDPIYLELAALEYREAVLQGVHPEFLKDKSPLEVETLLHGLWQLHGNTPKDLRQSPENKIIELYLRDVCG